MNNEIIINKRKISESDKPFVIAELSANHNGNIERAKETILLLKIVGRVQLNCKPIRLIQ